MNDHNNNFNNTSSEVLIGRLGRDPDLRYTRNQKPVCLLSVATQNVESQRTIWNKVVVWGKQAEMCKQYLVKGKEVFVRGQREVKEFATPEGLTKRYEEIKANLIGFSLI